jgi:endonuclease/exonuclease/phosphatase family metal-dependent hydrolase
MHALPAILSSALCVGLMLVVMGCETRAAGGESTSTDEVTLRVVSYNIAAARDGSLEELATVLREINADVVALQEVANNWAEDTGFEHHASVLGDLLEMEAFYAPIYTIPDDDGLPRQFGLAILTSMPVVDTVNHMITRHSTQAENAAPEPMPGFPEMVVDAGGTHIRVFNTHLDFRRDPAVRQTQIGEMIEIMGDVSGPTLLIGDLNARPGAQELEPLFALMRDAWDSGVGDGFTHPAESPRQRIDYILYGGPCRVTEAFVVQTTASDHVPVVADIACRTE